MAKRTWWKSVFRPLVPPALRGRYDAFEVAGALREGLGALATVPLRVWALTVAWLGAMYALESSFEGSGKLFVISSIFLLIFTNLGSRTDGSLSAYSVFNEGYEQLAGAFTAADAERAIRAGGGLGALVGGVAGGNDNRATEGGAAAAAVARRLGGGGGGGAGGGGGGGGGGWRYGGGAAARENDDNDDDDDGGGGDGGNVIDLEYERQLALAIQRSMGGEDEKKKMGNKKKRRKKRRG